MWVWPLDLHIYVLAQPISVSTDDSGEFKILSEGVVLCPRRNEETGVREWQIFPNLYYAIRGRAHAFTAYGLRGYPGEIQYLNTTRPQIIEALRFLLQFGELESEQRRKVRIMLARLAAKFRAVRAVPKVEAREKLTAATSERDRRGRPNVGARRARVVAAADRVTIRLADIRRITPRLSGQELVLLGERERILTLLRELHTELRSLLGSLGGWNGLKVSERLALLEFLRVCQREVRTLQVEPFLSYGRLLANDIDSAWAHLRRERVKTARHLLERARDSIAFKFFQRDLETVIIRLSVRLGRMDPRPLADEALVDIRRLEIQLKRLRETALQYRPLARVQKHLVAARLKIEFHKLLETGTGDPDAVIDLPSLGIVKSELKAASRAL